MVSRLKDEDLVWFKANHPAEIVRMNSAGTEGEYVFIQAMQKDNFFYQTSYPNIALSVLLTKHAVDYANSASDKSSTPLYIEGIQAQGPDISRRDFTENDFTAWTYDLFRPQEPYEARGIHPSGNGIRRDRTPGDLMDQALAYAQKVGKLQYVNFISPHLLGISRIKVSKNFAFNFAARHYLASFGYELGGDLFLKIKDKDILFTWHGYHKKDHFFPAVEAQLLDLQHPYPAHNVVAPTPQPGILHQPGTSRGVVGCPIAFSHGQNLAALPGSRRQDPGMGS